MPKPHLSDRIGPGSPAWNAFDNALEAWLDTPKGQRDGRSRTYKRYANCRDHMIRCLLKAKAPRGVINEWKRSLRERCKQDLADIEAYQASQHSILDDSRIK